MPIPQKIKMYYDPLGRVVKTVNPNNSQQWAISGIPNDLLTPSDPVNINASYIPTPWVNFTYDSNDLAPITNPTGSNVPSDHYYTPKSAEVDALGRTIKTTEHIDKVNNPPVDNIEMNYQYDVRGNLLLVKDPYDRNVFEHVYDLRPGSKDKPAPPIKTVHIDKGPSTILFDATGKSIESFDAKGAQGLSAYDILQRPIYIWAHDNTGETTTLRQFLFYGDSLGGTPEDDNLKGKLYQHYDEAGLVEIPEYDFKGNVLEKTRQVISDTELLSVFGGPTVTCYRVDWTGVPSSPPAILDTAVYQTSMTYDALNRIETLTYPEDLDSERKVLTPAYNNAGRLERVDLDGTTYVSNIAYNAKGQRILIAYGIGIMTRYVYDTLTFRLLRQRSESFSESDWVYSSTGNVKQDTAYAYDLIGNIVETNEATTGCGIGGSDELERDFEYDPIYRLISANGRENSPTITPIWDDSYRSTDDSTTTAYTQSYDYDKLGNIQSLQHTGNSSFTRTFNYSSTSNKLDSVDIGMTNYAFTYDDCGNQLTETSSRKWEWDSTDKPRCFYVDGGSITQYTQYLYDAGGKRVKKLTWKTGGIYDSIAYLDGIFEYRTDGTDEQNILHIMDNRSRIATKRIGDDFGDTTPATKYNLEDHLGSSMVLLEEDGSNVNKEEYYPFGETSFGSYAKKRYKYCGKERDEESGLYYYGARYYSAWVCRFVSVDPLSSKFPHYSSYQYAGNKPSIAVDLDGLEDIYFMEACKQYRAKTALEMFSKTEMGKQFFEEFSRTGTVTNKNGEIDNGNKGFDLFVTSFKSGSYSSIGGETFSFKLDDLMYVRDENRNLITDETSEYGKKMITKGEVIKGLMEGKNSQYRLEFHEIPDSILKSPEFKASIEKGRNPIIVNVNTEFRLSYDSQNKGYLETRPGDVAYAFGHELSAHALGASRDVSGFDDHLKFNGVPGNETAIKEGSKADTLYLELKKVESEAKQNIKTKTFKD